MKPLPLIAGLAVAYGLWRVAAPKSTGEPMRFVSSPAKRAMMALIASQFAARGFHENTGKAAIINAIAESNLDPAAVGDNGHAVGLFQISDLNGRRDLTGVDRKDPAQNTAWIIANEKTALARVDAAARAGAGVPELSAMFCQLVERPANAAKRAQERADLARTVYPA